MTTADREDRWLLPEGIGEALPFEAELLEQHRRRVLDLFRCWGYQLVMPPFIEYLESLLTGTGGDLDIETFKLIDQLTGRLMGVRADMTPQVARIEAHRLAREEPVRLCYLGTVLRTRPAVPGGSRSPLQLGAELYGHRGRESDLEVIELALETLAKVGIPSVQLDLGHVGIFRGLARQLGLSAAPEAALFDALQRKSLPDLEALVKDSGLDRESSRMLLSLVELHGADEVLAEAQHALRRADGAVLRALGELADIAAGLRRVRPDVDLHFDLAELRGYRYHTGIVFAGYLPGHGQAVAQGGRYDDIGWVFGRARPATGFSADLKQLVTLSPKSGERPAGIFAPWADDPALHAMVRELREAGERVVWGFPGQHGGAAEAGCDRRVVADDKGWRVV
jgi:ATP phosphoribosyltransferase regulatory subunit